MDNLQVAERIKKLREKHRLTKNALANLAGVSPTYIYQLEQGLKSPTVEYLGFICQALDVSLSDFFREEGSEPILQLSEQQKELLAEFIESLK